MSQICIFSARCRQPRLLRSSTIFFKPSAAHSSASSTTLSENSRTGGNDSCLLFALSFGMSAACCSPTPGTAANVPKRSGTLGSIRKNSNLATRWWSRPLNGERSLSMNIWIARFSIAHVHSPATRFATTCSRCPNHFPGCWNSPRR